MVMDRAQNHRGLVTMFVARSDWGPRAERVGGAEPGAERLQTWGVAKRYGSGL
jgi:hypothetical protein